MASKATLSPEALGVVNLLTSSLTTETAITITGSWGSGKTEIAHEVARHVREIKEPGRCHGWRVAYISLFGVSSLIQVDEMMKSALHREIPQPSRLINCITVDLTKTAIRKITGRKDSIFEASLNSIAFDSSTLVIFDDLERSSMPAIEMLGYIDRFVRNEDCRVLIVCENSRYSDHHTDGDAAAFRDFFEKISGHRVHIQGGRSNLEEAICISETESLHPDHRQMICAAALSAYRQGGDDNLRVLKAIMPDMVRLMNIVPERKPFYAAAFDGMLFAYAACCLEAKLGRISYKESKEFLQRREESIITKMHSKECNVSKNVATAINRYDLRIIDCRYVPVEVLRSTAFNIPIDQTSAKEGVLNCLIASSRSFYEVIQNWHKHTDEDLFYACSLAEREISRPSSALHFYHAIECLTEFTPYLKKVANKDLIRDRAMEAVRSTRDYETLWALVGYNSRGEKPLGNVARDVQSLANAILMKKISSAGMVAEKPLYIPFDDIHLLRSSLERNLGADAILEMFDEKTISEMLCHPDSRSAERIKMIFNSSIQELYRESYPQIERLAKLIVTAIDLVPAAKRREVRLTDLRDTALTILDTTS